MTLVMGSRTTPGLLEEVKEKKSERKWEKPSGEQAVQYDEGKLRYDLISRFALREVVRGATFGANSKYDDWNFLKGKGLSVSAQLASIERHFNKIMMGNDIDEESKVHHLGLIALRAMMAYETLMFHPEQDDRFYKNNKPKK